MSLSGDTAALWLRQLEIERRLAPSGRLPMSIVHRILYKHLYYDRETVATCALVCRRWRRQIGDVNEWMDRHRPNFPDRFPANVEQRIVAQLRHNRDALLQCSLMSRAWSQVSQDHLFRVVTLDSAQLGRLCDKYPEHTDSYETPTFRAYDAFLSMLEASFGGLGKSVREVRIVGQGWAAHSQPDLLGQTRVVDPTPATLRKIFLHLPNLIVLDLRNLYLLPDPSDWEFRSLTESLPLSLRDIRMYKVINRLNAGVSRSTRCALQQAIADDPVRCEAVTAINLEEPSEWDGAVGYILGKLGVHLKLARIDISRLSSMFHHVPSRTPYGPANISVCTSLQTLELVIALHLATGNLCESFLESVHSDINTLRLEIGEYESEATENEKLAKMDSVCAARLNKLKRVAVEIKVPVEKEDRAAEWLATIRATMARMQSAGKLEVMYRTIA